MNQTILPLAILIPFSIAGGVIVLSGLICAMMALGDWLGDRMGPLLTAFGVIAVFTILVASITSIVLTYAVL